MIINKKGKLFGIINIIDLAIILVVIAAVVVGAPRFLGNTGIVTTGTQETIVVRFFAEDSPTYAIEAVEIGTPLVDDTRVITLGTIIEINRGDAIVTDLTTGFRVPGDNHDHSSVEIVARTTAGELANGLIISGNQYGVGQSLTVRAGNARLFGRISGFEIVSE